MTAWIGTGARSVAPLLGALSIGTGQPAFAQAAPAEAPTPPAFLERGLPGPGHEALAPLVGTFAVEKTLYVGPGTPEAPVVSSALVAVRRWVGGKPTIEDVTEGEVAGAPSWREGHLGSGTMDRRHEWVTVDATSSTMMIDLGEPVPEGIVPREISVSGTVTDQGFLGEEMAGEAIGMRAVLRIESEDRHVLDLLFTPPGGEEFLADRSVYARVAIRPSAGAVGSARDRSRRLCRSFRPVRPP